ncbi:MAG: PEP-CTERM sorting domain-containing protein [Aquabacterium sp.]
MTFGTPLVEISQFDGQGVRNVVDRYEGSYSLLKGGLNDTIDVKFSESLNRAAVFSGTDTELKLSLPASMAGSSAWVGSVSINTFLDTTTTSPAKLEGSLTAWLGDQQVFKDAYIYGLSPTPVGIGDIRTSTLPIHQPFDRLELTFAVHQALQDGTPTVTLRLPYLQMAPVWATPVPEAGTGAMLTLGGVALAGLAWRRRQCALRTRRHIEPTTTTPAIIRAQP